MRTLTRKRLAGYRRVLRSYRKLGYGNAEVVLATGRSTGPRRVVIDSVFRSRAGRPIWHNGRMFYIGTIPPDKMRVTWRLVAAHIQRLGSLVEQWTAEMDRATEATVVAGTALQQLDAAQDRVEAGHTDRIAFSGIGGLITGPAQLYTKPLSTAEQEFGVVTEPVHDLIPDQYVDDVELAIDLATEILSGDYKGYASKARARAGISTTTRLKRDVLLSFWRWLQALSVEETGKMLQTPPVVLEAREK